MTYKGKVAAWSEIRTKHTNTLCGQNVELLNVKPGGRRRLKCDGTRAETRFRLSAKRTSPFKSAGASVQSTTGRWGVRISGSNTGYTMSRGSLPTPFASFPFTSPPVRHRVPSRFNWTLRKETARLSNVNVINPTGCITLRLQLSSSVWEHNLGVSTDAMIVILKVQPVCRTEFCRFVCVPFPCHR
jgi:hypothetical protein